MSESVQIVSPITEDAAPCFSGAALEFVADLHRAFNARRLELLEARAARQQRLLAGEQLGFLDETAEVRRSEWQVAPAPADLNDRRTEITGPCDRKMTINALNSGAKVFMADLEDASSPTWFNVTDGQRNLADAVRGTITFQNPDGREYALNETIATLLVRPRGWHLNERHLLIVGEEASGSLVDFGIYFFNNARELLDRGSGPYFYLPKLESHLEARLWNDVFTRAQEKLGIPHGSVRATVLIETLPAAFEMEEILYELRDHAAGLNAGRWDYIFSAIKTYRDAPEMVLPDRAQVTMSVPFMSAYARLLVHTCHKRGAHAIGGMAAFIPSRRDEQANAMAFAKVHEDKEREASLGFDGTWVAHPGLVAVAIEEFDAVLGDRPHQKLANADHDPGITMLELLAFTINGGESTEAGLRANISIALQYIDSWLNGVGAAAINNLMEDAATAEISRAQIWQWIRHERSTVEGQLITLAYYDQIRSEEMDQLGGENASRYADAAAILDQLVHDESFIPFLTLAAYAYLD